MAKELLTNLPSLGIVTAISTLKNELKKGETTLELEAGLPAEPFEKAEYQFRLVIGHEQVLVTAISGSGKKLTVTRNVGENSVEEDHPAKANVFNFLTKEAIEKFVKEQPSGEIIVGKATTFTERTFNAEHEASATNATIVYLTIKTNNNEENAEFDVYVDGVKVGQVFNKNVRSNDEFEMESIVVPKGKKWEVKIAAGTQETAKLWESHATLEASGAVGKEGKTGPAGPGPVNWRKEWKTGTLYKVNDGVELKGSSYICILEHESHEPPNATYWGVLAEAGKGVEGAVKTYVSYHATEVLATGTGHASPALQEGEEDKIAVTAPTGGATYLIYASAAMKNPGAGFGGVTLYIDGKQLKVQVSAAETTVNEVRYGSSAFHWAFSDPAHGTGSEAGWFLTELATPNLAETVTPAPAYVVFLPAGEHTIELRLFNEDRTNGRIKERRIQVVGP